MKKDFHSDDPSPWSGRKGEKRACTPGWRLDIWKREEEKKLGVCTERDVVFKNAEGSKGGDRLTVH